MDAITTNLSEAKDAWAEVVKSALDEMLKAYSDSLVEIEKAVNKEEELFEQLNTNVTTSIEDTTKQLDEFKTKIEKVLTETDSMKAGLTIMENLKKGLKQGWEDIRRWWNTSVAKSMDFSFKVGKASYTGGINIPRLATGGIVTGSTIANIGEYGKEAVLPLDRNTGWMNTLADKLNDSSNNSNNQYTLDLNT